MNNSGTNTLKPDKQNRRRGKLQYIAENGEVYDLDKILEYVTRIDNFKKEVTEEIEKIKGCLKEFVSSQIAKS